MKTRTLIKIVIYLAFILDCNIIFAQIKCATDEVMKKNTLLLQQISRNNAIYQKNRLSVNTLEEIPDNVTVYTVPVVFHIYHLGEAVGVGSNASLASVQNALLGMNNAFRAQAEYTGVSPDVRIQFVLAARTPTCGATDGIVRVDGRAVAGYEANGLAYGDDVAEAAFRALSSWPNSQYVNIRIFHDITGTGGYAYFLNDIFMPVNSLTLANSDFWAHEMGHSFNLYHTFEGDRDNSNNAICPINNNPATDGDLITDTDPHKREAACNTMALNECTNTAFGNVVSNIMSYSCGLLFTANQVYRMRYALLNYRKSLIFSSGGLPPAAGNLPTMACIPTAPNGLSPYFGISNFSLANIFYNGTSPEYTGANYENLTCLSQTNLQVGVATSFQLVSTYGNTARAKIFIDYNNDGDFEDMNEQVYNSSTWLVTHNGSITPPATANLKTFLRLRIMMDGTNMTACNLPGGIEDGSGMAVDFAVKILPVNCIQMQTVKSGNWNDPTIWSCGRIPLSTDNVTIANTDIVTVPMGVFHVKNINLIGTIRYLVGGELRLNQ